MSASIHRKRRFISGVIIALVIAIFGISQQTLQNQQVEKTNKKITSQPSNNKISSPAIKALQSLQVKGRAPKTNYSRDQFGHGWRRSGDCDTRQIILARDLQQTSIKDCKVYSGKLNDPYTGKAINFRRGPGTSSKVQIDHVVALSDSWQKGAQQLSMPTRENLANDPLELLAVDGPANQQKSDGDAATWLPSNKPYRCQYVARQIAVKQKYSLWVTPAEHDAIAGILQTCPSQVLPVKN